MSRRRAQNSGIGARIREGSRRRLGKHVEPSKTATAHVPVRLTAIRHCRRQQACAGVCGNQCNVRPLSDPVLIGVSLVSSDIQRAIPHEGDIGSIAGKAVDIHRQRSRPVGIVSDRAQIHRNLRINRYGRVRIGWVGRVHRRRVDKRVAATSCQHQRRSEQQSKRFHQRPHASRKSHQLCVQNP